MSLAMHHIRRSKAFQFSLKLSFCVFLHKLMQSVKLWWTFVDLRSAIVVVYVVLLICFSTKSHKSFNAAWQTLYYALSCHELSLYFTSTMSVNWSEPITIVPPTPAAQHSKSIALIVTVRGRAIISCCHLARAPVALSSIHTSRDLL